MTTPLTKEIADEAQVAAPPASALPVEIELRPLARRPESESAAAERQRALPRRRWGGAALFWATVGLPVAAGALYLFVIAAPRYASEASFIVRSASSGASSGVSSLMQTRGVSRAVDETFAVSEYLTSPEVLDKLTADNGLREILARPEADVFNRYPGPFARENFYSLRRRFESMLTQTVDEATGISRIEVVAFRPEDSQAIATALLKYAEEMVNRLNERAYRDALAISNKFVESAMSGLKDTETALTAYRDATGSVDPTGEAAATMKIIQTLSAQLSRNEASVLEQEAMAPQSPQSASLREKVTALRAEIEGLRQKVVGTGPSTASKMGKFEELVLRRELAAKTLENAVLSRDKARENAENQHLYVQVIRAPSLADVARYPRAWLDMAFLLATSGMIYLVLRGFARAAQEHRV